MESPVRKGMKNHPHETKGRSKPHDDDNAVAGSMPDPDDMSRHSPPLGAHEGPNFRCAVAPVEHMVDSERTTGRLKFDTAATRDASTENEISYPLVLEELERDSGHSPGDRPEFNTPEEWVNLVFQPVPTYYPLEQSNIVLDLEEFPTKDIILNITRCLKAMSVQAKFFPKPPSAALLTPENVEMHLALWRSRSGKETVVEIQRRRGCSMTFHRYGRRLLDAARGDFDASEFIQRNDATGINCANLKAAEKLIYSEVPKMTGDQEDSLVSLKVVSGLLKKPRLEARILAMETLCVLANPRRTLISTSSLVSRAVLLGKSGQNSTDTPVDEKIFSEIHDFLLAVILHRSMKDDEIFATAPMDIDSDDENFFESDDEGDNNRSPELKEVMSVMFNLALTVLAYALEVMLNFDALDSEPENTNTPRSTASVAMTFLQGADGLLETLLDGLRKAKKKPHNACLCAQCLRFLCQASEIIVQDTLALNAGDVVKHALHVGETSHAKLEHECGRLLTVLGYHGAIEVSSKQGATFPSYMSS